MATWVNQDPHTPRESEENRATMPPEAVNTLRRESYSLATAIRNDWSDPDEWACAAALFDRALGWQATYLEGFGAHALNWQFTGDSQNKVVDR